LSPPGQARTIKNGLNNRLFVRHSCESRDDEQNQSFLKVT